MAYLITIHVFREDTGQSMAGVPVSLSLSGYNDKTDSSGRVSFNVPDNSGDVYIFVNGTQIPKHGYPYDLRNVNVMVTPSGYFSRMV